jgi:hypothetical protein
MDDFALSGRSLRPGYLYLHGRGVIAVHDDAMERSHLPALPNAYAVMLK